MFKHTALSIGINFFLTDHCNLNCKGCMAFAPIVEPSFLDIQSFTNDIARLAYLSNSSAHAINLLGGEPLLHPDLKKFMMITRKYFNNSIIRIFTNGLLFNKIDDSFFVKSHELGIELWITKYPVAIDYNNIIGKLHNFRIKHTFINDKWLEFKYSKKIRNGDLRDAFDGCYQNRTSCHSLVDGIYYPCGNAGRFYVFQKYYSDIFPSMINGIDIHKANSLDEILDFISNPIPLCGYCGIKSFKPTNWAKSTRELSEWIDFS